MVLLKKKQDPDDSSHLKGAEEQPTDDKSLREEDVTTLNNMFPEEYRLMNMIKQH